MRPNQIKQGQIGSDRAKGGQKSNITHVQTESKTGERGAKIGVTGSK